MTLLTKLKFLRRFSSSTPNKKPKTLNLNTLRTKKTQSSASERLKQKNKRMLKVMPYEAPFRSFSKQTLYLTRDSRKEWIIALVIVGSVDIIGGWYRVALF